MAPPAYWGLCDYALYKSTIDIDIDIDIISDSSLPPPGALTFDHQTISSALLLALVRVLEIEHSQLPGHASIIVFTHTPVGLHRPCTPFTGN